MAKKNSVIENKKKYKERISDVKTDDIDTTAMNVMINKAINIVDATLTSTSTPAKEKRDKALAIVNKYMPSGLNVKHEAGDNFLELVKQIHKKPSRKTKKKTK